VRRGGRVDGKMSNTPTHKAHEAPRSPARSKQTGQPFGIRIRAGDKAQHRTFIAQYKIGEKHRRITLGDVRKVTLENARREARRIFGSVVNGHDPANEKAERRSAASHTLDATIARYLEAKATELTGDDAAFRRTWTCHLIPLRLIVAMSPRCATGVTAEDLRGAKCWCCRSGLN